MLAIAAGLTLALTGCSGQKADFRDPDVPAGSFGLVAFDSCQQALDGLRSAARTAVGPYGFNGGGIATDAAMPSAAEKAGTVPVPAPAAGADRAGAGMAEPAAPNKAPEYSGTNTHEVGADEPDLVKTDGRRIITVSQGRLRVVDAASRRLTGAIDLVDPNRPSEAYKYAAGDLLLAGDHALVLMNQSYAYPTTRGPVVDIMPAPGGGPTDPAAIVGPEILLVDLKSSKLLSRARVDGSLVDARQTGSTARVVVRSSPRIDFPMDPMPPGDVPRRIAANQAVIDKTGIEAWAPRVEVTTGGSTKQSRVGCEAINRPSMYSGTNMLTVLTFDLGAAALTDGQPVSIVADGDTVYGTGPTLYVASNQAWRAVPMEGGRTQPVEPSTEIYKFDTASPGRPTFVAGGSVPGYLINQYAMSEWDSKLRVATTSDNGGTQHSGVYVLGQDGDVLTSVGAVDGLGKGERIYAVRFVATVGYVVTFRQTDPLYTVDLSDPTRPTVKGELKIPGYSAYLHPAGGSKLIGVGQDATSQGRVTGTQVSLFDVGDLTNPSRLAQYKLSGAHSEAEFEPHAFLYWPQDGLVVLPLQSYTASRQMSSAGALVLRISGTEISQVGFISHPGTGGYAPPVRRSLIIDTTLWTVSDAGLLASDSHSLARLAWIPF